MITELQRKHGPFAKPCTWAGIKYTVAGTVYDQLPDVKASTDPEWLRFLLAHATKFQIGKVICKAAAARLRKLCPPF